MVWRFFHGKSNASRRRKLSPLERRTRPTLEDRVVPYALSGYSWPNPNLSFSYVPDGASWEGTTSNLYATLNAVAATATWQREFARALQTWANSSPLNFYEVSDNGSTQYGQMRLGAYGWGETSSLAYAWYPQVGDITLNSDHPWNIGDYLDLFSVLIHESGHALGLGHSSDVNAVMYGQCRFRTGLGADDIAGIQAIYGARTHDAYDASSSNDSLGSATSLTLSSGGVTLSADLTTMSDIDYYRVTVPTGADGTLTVTLTSENISLLAGKLWVLDSAGNVVAVADAGSDYESSLTISLTGLAVGQTYYLVADGATSDVFGMGAYQLQAQFGGSFDDPPPPPALPPDSAEVNDTMGSAYDFGTISGASRTGLTLHTASDMDYFSFVPRKSGTYNVSITFTHASGNLDLTVYNAAGTVLGSSTSSSSNELVSLSLSAGQRYYVKVHSPAGATDSYDLSIVKPATSGGGKGGKGGSLRLPGGWEKPLTEAAPGQDRDGTVDVQAAQLARLLDQFGLLSANAPAGLSETARQAAPALLPAIPGADASLSRKVASSPDQSVRPSPFTSSVPLGAPGRSWAPLTLGEELDRLTAPFGW
jgi:hypothetical protein